MTTLQAGNRILARRLCLAAKAADNHRAPLSLQLISSGCRNASTTSSFNRSAAAANQAPTPAATPEIIVRSKTPPVQIPANVSLRDFVLNDSVANHATKTAMVNGVTGQSFNFADFDAIGRSFGHGLALKYGLAPDESVAFFLHNSPEFVMALLGVTGNGSVVSPVNPAYTPHELARQLQMSKAKIVLTEAAQTQTVEKAAQLLERDIRIILVDEKDGYDTFYDLVKHSDSSGISSSSNTIPIQSDKVAMLPFSSGTTGLSKGVMLTHGNLVGNLCQAMYGRGLSTFEKTTDTYQPSTICVLPLFHIFATMATTLPTLHLGGKVVTVPSFEAKSFLKLVEEVRPTFMSLVPPLVGFYANHPDVEEKHTKDLTFIFAAAAPIGETLGHQFMARAPNCFFREGWGMTETSPTCTVTAVDDVKFGSCGVLLANTEAKVVDLTTGESLGPNKRGELWVRGPQVMKGYIDNEEATKNTITPDGWLKSGDIAYYDEQERFYIVDRLKELIKVHGFQVPPAELEDLIRSHESVLDVAVIGIDDAKFGQVPKAYVVPKEGEAADEAPRLTEKQVEEFVNERVTDFKRLRGGVEFIDAIPKNASGKTLRRDLIALNNKKAVV